MDGWSGFFFVFLVFLFYFVFCVWGGFFFVVFCGGVLIKGFWGEFDLPEFIDNICMQMPLLVFRSRGSITFTLCAGKPEAQGVSTAVAKASL